MDQLEGELTRGKYSTGDKLPSLMDLSKSLKVNHLTIRKGLQGLARKGLIDIRPRVGVFVTDRPRQPARKTTRIVLGCRTYMLDGSKHHPAVGAFLAGAHARDRGNKLSVQTMFFSRDRLAEQLGASILAQQIDGFVACSDGPSVQDAEFFRRHKIPFVQCGMRLYEHDWPVRVYQSPAPILRQAVEHLRALGHQRIGFICWEPLGDNDVTEREFNQLAFDHRLGDPRELHVKVANPENNSQWHMIENFFDIKPLPTAVVIFDEFMTDVFLAGCDRRGIRVPQDLSVASLYDNMPFGHRVPLTATDTVKMNARIIETACDVLERWIDGQTIPQRRIDITTDLIPKASTGPAPVADRSAS